jgi:hypothetical protein
MNMAETDKEQPELFRIAELTGLVKNPDDEHRLFPEHQQDHIHVSWEGDRAILSTLDWGRASWKHRLAMTHAVLTTFDCIEDAPAAQLYWSFSTKVVCRADAAKQLSYWSDEGAPSVMDFIDFVIEDLADGRSIRTRGLAAIFGHELDAFILGPTDHDLAKMVAQLAQDLLQDGPLNNSGAVGIDGQKYLLTTVSGRSTFGPTIRLTMI